MDSPDLAAEPDRRSARPWAIAAALFAVTLLVYAPVTGHDFVSLDDPGYVQNRHVRSGLTADGVAWAFTREHSSNWHPLTWLSHMLDVELFGQDPGAHHGTSMLLHALSAVLLFVFLLRATGAEWPSLIVAALFALHPQRVESVAWVAERKDVLSGLFFLLTLLAYEHYTRKPCLARLGAVVLTTALGLLAKPMLVTLPFVLLLLDVWPLRREAGRRLVLEKLPLFALAAASCALTIWAQSSGQAVKDFGSLPVDARLANALDSWLAYLTQALWPAGLAVFYPHPALVQPDFEPWRLGTLVAGAFLVVATLFALVSLRRRPWVFTGWLWYAGMLVPVIGLIQVGGQRMADRYAYLPLVGIYLLVVYGARSLLEPRARTFAGTAGLIVVGVYGFLTFRQVAVWKDTFTLFEHALAVTERNYVAHNNLGLAHLSAGDHEAAIEHFEARVAISPAVGAFVNLSVAHARLGQLDQAERALERALAFRPNSRLARERLDALRANR